MQCYTRYIDENERCEYSSGWNELFSSNNLIIFSTYSFVRKKSFFKQLILNRSKQGDSRNNKRRHEREARTFKTIRSSTSNKIIRLDGRETTEYHRNNILQFLATYKLINNILSKNKKPKYSSSPWTCSQEETSILASFINFSKGQRTRWGICFEGKLASMKEEERKRKKKTPSYSEEGGRGLLRHSKHPRKGLAKVARAVA